MLLKKNLYLLLCLFLLGCSSAAKKAKVELAKMDTKERRGTFVDDEFPPTDITVKPGEVEKFVFKGPEIKNGKLICNDKKLFFYYDGETYLAFIAETYFSKLKPYHCTYGTKKKRRIVARVNVETKEFPTETLNVDKKRVVLNKKDKARSAREWHFKQKIWKKAVVRPLFSSGFKVPLDSYVTSIYGSKRLFNKMKQTQHLGTDFRAAVGLPIHASNAGKVVIARDLFYSGNTVIIDHGVGIFTIYGHLSKLKTVEGEYVPKGALLGLSGATGRVTGPHLHWGVRVNGKYVEGSSLAKTTSDME